MNTLTSVLRPWALQYVCPARGRKSGPGVRNTLLQEEHYCFSIFRERGVRQGREGDWERDREREGSAYHGRRQGGREGDHEDLRDGIGSAAPADRQKVAGFAADPREIFLAFRRSVAEKGAHTYTASSGPTEGRGLHRNYACHDSSGVISEAALAIRHSSRRGKSDAACGPREPMYVQA